MSEKLRFIFLAVVLTCFETSLVRSEKFASPKIEGKAVFLPLQAAGVTNLFRLSDRIYSGAAPEGEEGFQSLAKLGIKTIITVDGSKPEVARAHKYGLRYVHLPHGYDGIDNNTQARLIKAAETLPGPIFVHCHHGQHRGPTAAAVICLGTEGWNRAEAESWLRTAGTATNYVGLFQTVRRFHLPSEDQLRKTSSDFPETARTDDLVDTMVAIDGQWDHLKAIRKARYQTLKEHPDLDPPNEALILREHFREAQRLPESAQRGKEFLAQLKDAESRVEGAEKLLRQFQSEGTSETPIGLDRALDGVGQACASCHKTFRDPVRN